VPLHSTEVLVQAPDARATAQETGIASRGAANAQVISVVPLVHKFSTPTQSFTSSFPQDYLHCVEIQKSGHPLCAQLHCLGVPMTAQAMETA